MDDFRVNQALNQWPPNQEGLGDRAWQCNDGVRAVGLICPGGGPQSVTRSHGHGFGVFRSE